MTDEHGLSPLLSPLLTEAGFRHAFFTRAGGVSEGAYGALNFAWSTGDHEARVRENLARAAAFLGVPPAALFFLSQVHGAHVHAVGAGDQWDDVVQVEGDAVLSRDPSVACGVRVADCVPILLADTASGATCAIHSGWRGTTLDIVGASVSALRRASRTAARGDAPDSARGASGAPAPISTLIAAVGPHIGPASFEVGEEVASVIEERCGVPGVVDRVRFAKPHVDLRAIVDAQLRRAGVTAIDHVGGDTFADAAAYFSFRRDGKASGRHLAAIVPREVSL